MAGERLLVFHGHIDNSAALAEMLGETGRSPARLFAAAVERWGDDADRHVIGEYCSVILDRTSREARLSRSPLRAPPLHYFRGAESLIAASVPRALFAAGAPCRLNEQRIADSLWLNFSDEEASWYEGLARVPLGTFVRLSRTRTTSTRYYDLSSLPEVRLRSDGEYFERAEELLDEGVRAALEGSRQPGVTLSSGLDSPQVAFRASKALPAGQRLPSFTFVPEPGWDGVCPRGMHGDEQPAVEAFARMHPAIDPSFVANEGIEHDHRWNELFHVMGCAPSGLCNMYVFHGIWAAAAKRGCDRLLLAEWGNFTFSAKGEWAFPEYLLTGKWRQLWLALSRHPHDHRSMTRRFAALALAPLLPPRVYSAVQRVFHPDEKHPLELISALHPEFARSTRVVERAHAARIRFGDYKPVSKRAGIRMLFANADAESADVYQGFEQLYGVEQRDPMAYRPWVEFCLGLPTTMIVRDGESRWLAKQLGRGIMPEAQRRNRSNGRWDADWHHRIGRRREDWLRELQRHGKASRTAALLDIPKMQRALEDFPPTTSTDPQVWMPIELGVPRALLTARFVNFVEGRNDL